MAPDRTCLNYRKALSGTNQGELAKARLEPLKSINFEALFSASPDPYVLLSPSLDIVGMNEAYLRSPCGSGRT